MNSGCQLLFLPYQAPGNEATVENVSAWGDGELCPILIDCLQEIICVGSALVALASAYLLMCHYPISM